MRRLILAAALLLPVAAHAQLAIKDGNGTGQNLSCVTVSGNYVCAHSGGAGTITQTTVSLTANTSAQVIAANAARRYLFIQIRSGGSVTIAPGATGTTVTAGAGLNLDPATSGLAGGSVEFGGTFLPTNAFSAISTQATVLTVWEGQ